MRPQDEMWIEVLEWMGWTIPDNCSHKNKSKGAPPPFGKRPGTKNDWTSLPPLTLDALHEAERKLTPEQSAQYERLLEIEMDREFLERHTIFVYPTWHASKEQRLLALWRTIRPPA